MANTGGATHSVEGVAPSYQFPTMAYHSISALPYNVGGTLPTMATAPSLSASALGGVWRGWPMPSPGALAPPSPAAWGRSCNGAAAGAGASDRSGRDQVPIAAAGALGAVPGKNAREGDSTDSDASNDEKEAPLGAQRQTGGVGGGELHAAGGVCNPVVPALPHWDRPALLGAVPTQLPVQRASAQTPVGPIASSMAAHGTAAHSLAMLCTAASSATQSGAHTAPAVGADVHAGRASVLPLASGHTPPAAVWLPNNPYASWYIPAPLSVAQTGATADCAPGKHGLVHDIQGPWPQSMAPLLAAATAASAAPAQKKRRTDWGVERASSSEDPETDDGRSRASLLAQFPEVAREWHAEKNRGLVDGRNGCPITLETVTVGSGRKVWWKCDQGHEWQARVFHRTRELNPSRCPQCSGVRRHREPLRVTHPELAAEWHERNDTGETLRGGRHLSPDVLTAGSVARVWWRCRVCEMEWQARVCDRSRARDRPNCPRCSRRGRKRRSSSPESDDSAGSASG